MKPQNALFIIFEGIRALDPDHPAKRLFDDLLDTVEDYADDIGGMTDISADIVCGILRDALNVPDNDSTENK